ncbi:MAG: N-acetylneuraminate synthase family protein [Candidatus Yanofskybacteria bacterium]|nr:N-acetylneuraminate synthase family protein [Candidatus Yanofskybacteria bacterium]
MTKNTPEAIWDKVQKGVFIIAEAGKNFIQTKEEQTPSEYLENAKHLVDAAVQGGADAVKFQTHCVDDEVMNINFISPHFTAPGSSRYQWVRRNTEATPLEEFWKPLKQYCDEKGIIFMSTPMSRNAAKMLEEEVGVNVWKIGSGDILDFVCLDFVRNTQKPILLSSGMSTLDELRMSLKFVGENNARVAMLHCVSKYPCPPEELFLGTINLLKEEFDVPIGFSDHSLGVFADLVAVALGASVIEKHFTLSRDLYGADHKISMTPDEFASLTASISKVLENSEKKKEILESEYANAAISKKEKVLQEGEVVFRPLFRKALVFGQDVPKGAVLTEEMVYAMRPQAYIKGLPSERYEEVLGKVVSQDVRKFDPITEDVIG